MRRVRRGVLALARPKAEAYRAARGGAGGAESQGVASELMALIQRRVSHLSARMGWA